MAEELFDAPIPTVTGEDLGVGGGVNVGFDVIDPLEATVKRSLIVEGGADGNIISKFDGPIVLNNKLTSTSAKGIEATSLFLQGDRDVSRKYTVGISTPSLSGNVGDIVYDGKISHQDAVKALEHCAVLIEDDNLPTEVDRKILLRLLRIVLGRPLSDVTANTTVEISKEHSSVAINYITLVRGAILNLTQDMHLVSISIFPQKVKETPKALRFIAMSKGQEGKHATP